MDSPLRGDATGTHRGTRGPRTTGGTAGSDTSPASPVHRETAETTEKRHATLRSGTASLTETARRGPLPHPGPASGEGAR